jgi:hypothetical protein
MLFQLHEWDIHIVAAVLMMPAGQTGQQQQQRTIRRTRPVTSAIEDR